MMRTRQDFVILGSARLVSAGRAWLRVACVALLLAGACCRQVAPASSGLTEDDRAFLDDLQRRSFRFFWDEMDPSTGLTPDRALADGGPSRANRGKPVCSIASIGFALTAYCIADHRGWITRQQAYG